MNKRRLTFKRVFDAHTCHYSEPTITARFDSFGEGETNQIIVETEETLYEDMNARRFVRNKENRFLVGEVVNRLYEYEELGYSPEEIKEIIDDRKKLKERLNSLHGTTAFNVNYGRIHRMSGPYPWGWNIPEIDNVIFNDPATIIFWADGTKTVVKADKEDFDPEKGLAMAISKKALGNKGNYFDIFKKWTKKCKSSPKNTEPVESFRPTSQVLKENAARENKQNAIQALKRAIKHTRVTKEFMRCAMEEAIRYLEKEN